MSGKLVEQVMDLNGQRLLVHKRDVDVAGDRHAEYSMDRCETWHPTMIEAYKSAVKSDSLVRIQVDGEEGNDESFEAFVIQLLQVIQGLDPGESFRVIRSQDTIGIFMEQQVVTARASTIGDVDLRLGGGG